MRLGVFGGTFNPVHYGHLRAAEEALEALRLDSIMFVPAGNPPLKDSGLVDVEQRFRMVELAIESNPKFSISRIEAQSQTRSYTVDTLRMLEDQLPGASLVFILGVDAFSEIHLWKDPEGLLQAADFAVLSRPGYSFAPIGGLPHVRIPVESLCAIDSGSTRIVEGALGGGRRLHLLSICDLGISATMIRDLVARGGSIRYLLPERVESFIISNRLYHSPDQ